MLVATYNKIAIHLEPQVQGTCGVYSFYNAVRILREEDSRNPAVPPPKKSQKRADDASGGAHPSLRQYAKRQLKSGQGEVLTEREMLELVAAHGYAPLAFGRRGGVTLGDKKEFLKTCMKQGYPVLVPYLADEVASEIKYVGAVTRDCGAHWSLIIGLVGDSAQVIEPNAPKALKQWPLSGLMQSNAKTDDKKFVEFWTKIVIDQAEYDRQITPGAKAKTPTKTPVRGIGEYHADPKSFTPSWDSQTGGKVKLYDLGGDDGKRQDKQDLNHVLIGIIPPFLARP